MKKEILKAESAKWNQVYENDPEVLPWLGIGFPDEVKQFLSGLNHKDAVLVTGCGVGDVADRLTREGFTKAFGTDISEVAIETAKKSFSAVSFETIATEKISLQKKFNDMNVIDWLNLHQVSDINEYIDSLGKISKNLCIVWINNFVKDSSVKSYVHSGNIYYHNPEVVKNILEQKGLSFEKQFNFIFTTNPKAGTIHQHTAVGQIYVRK